MSIKRIFIVISAIFAVSAVFADNSSVTSKKYVDDLMSGYQGKLPGSGANTLMIYDNSEDGIGEKSIAATLGNSASAVSVPTVGAVKTGLDGLQDTITGTAGYVMTGMGTNRPGEVGERAIYSSTNNYSDALVTAETVNTGVINAVNSSLRRVNENGDLDSNGTLWEINTSLFALDVLGYLPDGYTQLQYVDMNSGSYLLTDIVPTYDSKVEMDFQTTTLPSGSVYFVGGRTETNGGLFFARTVNAGFIVAAFDTRYNSNISVSDNTRYRFIYDNQVAKVESAGTTLFTKTFTGTDATGAAFCINGLNTNGTITTTNTGIYLYSFKVWNPTGQLVAKYVPATYNNTVGLYDTVSGTFKTAEVGTFTAGPSCISPNLFDVSANPLEQGGIASSDGQDTTSSYGQRVRTNGYVPVKPNTTYTASVKDLQIYYLEYKQDKTYTNRHASGFSDNSVTFTTGANTYFIRLQFRESDNADITPSEVTNVQLEQGSSATTYRPYGENICD